MTPLDQHEAAMRLLCFFLGAAAMAIFSYAFARAAGRQTPSPSPLLMVHGEADVSVRKRDHSPAPRPVPAVPHDWAALDPGDRPLGSPARAAVGVGLPIRRDELLGSKLLSWALLVLCGLGAGAALLYAAVMDPTVGG